MTNIFDQMASDEQPDEPVLEHELAASEATSPLPEPDEPAGRTPHEIKVVLQELLKHGYLEEATRPDLFRHSIIHRESIGEKLEPLDLALRIDSHRGVTFLAIAPNPMEAPELTGVETDQDPWSHPLVRKHRLTLEQSLLVAILRQAFAMHEQESGVGQAPAKIAVDELLPTFLTYFGESGSDSKDENRLLQVLDQLKTHGIVSEVDPKHEVTIRPLIAHLASPESLLALLNVLKEKSESPSDLETAVTRENSD